MWASIVELFVHSREKLEQFLSGSFVLSVSVKRVRGLGSHTPTSSPGSLFFPSVCFTEHAGFGTFNHDGVITVMRTTIARSSEGKKREPKDERLVRKTQTLGPFIRE